MKLNVTGSEYVLPLFGYPVYSSKELYSFTEEEYNNLKNEETEGNTFVENSYQTKGFILKDPRYKNITNFINKHIQKYSRDVLKIRDDLDFEITHSWVNHNYGGSGHYIHHHPNSVFTGILNITETEDTPVIFEDMGTSMFMLDMHPFSEYNMFNSRSWEYKCSQGQIIIFPSTLYHSVVVSYDKNKFRSTLSFNTFLKGSTLPFKADNGVLGDAIPNSWVNIKD